VPHIPVNSKLSIFSFYIFSYSLLTHCSWAYKPTINIQEGRAWLVVTYTVKRNKEIPERYNYYNLQLHISLDEHSTEETKL
jgi:hypothetical protein